MKIKKVYVIGAILGILLAGYWYGCRIECNKKEGYGQDASVRASAGWVAGNGMYGFDPIQQFADQIAQMRADHTSYNGVEGFCPHAETGRCDYHRTGKCPYSNVFPAYPAYPPGDRTNRLMMASPYVAGSPCGCD